MIPDITQDNMFYLEGIWQNNPDNMALISNQGKIMLTYTAKEVYMVAGSLTSSSIDIYNDDTLVKTIQIDDQQLYTLVKNDDYGTHQLRIEATKRVEAYTFTFG